MHEDRPVGARRQPYDDRVRLGRLLSRSSHAVPAISKGGTVRYASPTVERALGNLPNHQRRGGAARVAVAPAKVPGSPGTEVYSNLRLRCSDSSCSEVEGDLDGPSEAPGERCVVLILRRGAGGQKDVGDEALIRNAARLVRRRKGYKSTSWSTRRFCASTKRMLRACRSGAAA